MYFFVCYKLRYYIFAYEINEKKVSTINLEHFWIGCSKAIWTETCVYFKSMHLGKGLILCQQQPTRSYAGRCVKLRLWQIRLLQLVMN